MCGRPVFLQGLWEDRLAPPADDRPISTRAMVMEPPLTSAYLHGRCSNRDTTPIPNAIQPKPARNPALAPPSQVAMGSRYRGLRCGLCWPPRYRLSRIWARCLACWDRFSRRFFAGKTGASVLRLDPLRGNRRSGRIVAPTLYYAPRREGSDVGVDPGAHCYGFRHTVLGISAGTAITGRGVCL